MRILLIAGDVRRNMGDRAIRAAIVAQVRRVDPGAEIHSYSRSPERDEKEFGVPRPAGSVLRLLLNVRRLRSMDAVLWGGGQLLQDDSSKLKCVYWAVLLKALRLVSRRPIVGYGVGIGPLSTAWGRFFARSALRNVRRLIVRDRASATCVASLGGGMPPLSVAPDPVVVLEPADAGEAAACLRDVEGTPGERGEIRVGIALRRWFHVRNNWFPHRWHMLVHPRRVRGAERFEKLKENLVHGLNGLARLIRVRCLFFPMYHADWEGDVRESHDMLRRLDAPGHVLGLDGAPGMVMALAGQCDLFVGVRLHGALLALGMGVPVLGIAYGEKFQTAFSAFGMSDHLLSVEEAAGENGGELIRASLVRMYESRLDLARRVRGNRARLVAGCSAYEELLTRLRRGEPV